MHDLAALLVAFDRGVGNRGAATPGVDGPTAADGIGLRKISAIPVTRYRYRGDKVPSPWVFETA
ncbi:MULTISPECIES: hypothetical protein [unclassified Streptomyces]|uniref:hypothetical protein n=1 Tax=unclassified Streptomyces TaxID=2593676 RepID=UPI0007EDF7FD|nr:MULTISPECIES: hypothetical protein [unclassified Streptomyces]OBQ53142.1 hypothetical protein A4U61_02700 [Streptomyces sp. H-KF8]